ncbi:hypothetical protein Lalb_Chr02g0156691 [Lupinus albus]|uniref:Uncharacterized protein n=1 Tax=Lupinus albus TaxID=3870 RepID=A0A6A4R0W2_LUPAL|nr:hypothetical protein Lalb_Chr02g0156691 [Lupinus albus]
MVISDRVLIVMKMWTSEPTSHVIIVVSSSFMTTNDFHKSIIIFGDRYIP